MAAPVQAEALDSLREWCPLSDLFNKLPTKVQSGLFHQDVKLTCVDVLPDYIALGTNVGIVYWYNRTKKDLQRLRCECSGVPLAVIKIISTVDYMVACGGINGNVSIFQVPKSHPESLPESLKPKNKQVERYTVTELHTTPISAIEWSKNGMKLFTGDKEGKVVLTEIDFNMHLCKSAEILNEAYEVVQLSYHRQILLISTIYRSIICHKSDRWTVSQVGTKDRKVLGKFGGMFCKNTPYPANTTIYCTRPGLRIWISDLQGTVQKTLLFKDLLNYECPEIPVINPISNKIRKLKPQLDASFGILLPFKDDLIVTHNNDVVYVLNPENMCALYKICNLRSVLGVATSKNEIFILEGERSLIRVSDRPEPLYDLTPSIPIAANFLPISSSIRDLTSKFQSTAIMSALPPFIENSNYFNVHMDSTSVINAEEVQEYAANTLVINAEEVKEYPHPPHSDATNSVSEQNTKKELYDPILFKQHKNRRKNNKTKIIYDNSNVSGSEDKETNYYRPALMDLSTVGILPDLRSPDSILSDIQQKEEMLADILNFDKVTKLHSEEVKNLDCEESSKDPSVDLERTSEFLKNLAADGILSKNCTGNFYIKPCVNISCDKTRRHPNALDDQNPITDTPACVNVPNDWKLVEIQLNTNTMEGNDSPDISLAEWEII